MCVFVLARRLVLSRRFRFADKDWLVPAIIVLIRERLRSQVYC